MNNQKIDFPITNWIYILVMLYCGWNGGKGLIAGFRDPSNILLHLSNAILICLAFGCAGILKRKKRGRTLFLYASIAYSLMTAYFTTLGGAVALNPDALKEGLLYALDWWMYIVVLVITAILVFLSNFLLFRKKFDRLYFISPDANQSAHSTSEAPPLR